MMTTTEIGTTGIMFDVRADEDHPHQFPRFRDLPYSWHQLLWGENLAEDLRDWWAIAYDPRGLMYGDESWRAADVTNWDVIVADVTGVEESEVPKVYATMSRLGHTWTLEGEDEARDAGYAIIGRILCVAPIVARDGIDEDGYDEDGFWHEDPRADRIDIAQDLSKPLADYPLLDGEGYSMLEHDAWCEYASNGLDSDTLRGLPDLDDDTRDAVLDAWQEIWPVMSANAHYYSGWDGSIGPDAPELLASVVVDALARVARVS